MSTKVHECFMHQYKGSIPCPDCSMSTKPITPDEFFYLIDEYCTLAQVVALEFNQDAKHSARLKELGDQVRNTHRTLYEHSQQLEAELEEITKTNTPFAHMCLELEIKLKEAQQQLTVKEQELKAIPESLEIAITELAYRKQEIRVKDELIQRATKLIANDCGICKNIMCDWCQWLADASKVVK